MYQSISKTMTCKKKKGDYKEENFLHTTYPD